MYTRFYGFTKKPFENTPDPEFLYLSENHREVLASLAYGVNSAKGLILAMGDVGTGKTTLINALLKQLDPSFVIVRITNPRLVFGRSTFTNILEFFSSELGLRRDRENNRDLIEEVTKELEKLDREGRKAVLIIDEAHLLSEESLHDIRLLSNIENQKTKLIQILLIGQNELNKKLQKDTLRALKQRFNVSRMLRPLNRSETGDYILHRLHVAGRDSQIFDKKALALIFKKSSGVPRLINQICDSSLLIGYAVEARTIGAKVVREVIDDMDAVFGSRKKPSSSLLKRWGRPAAWTALALVIAVTVAMLTVGRPFFQRKGGHGDATVSQPSQGSLEGRAVDRTQSKTTRSGDSRPLNEGPYTSYPKKMPVDEKPGPEETALVRHGKQTPAPEMSKATGVVRGQIKLGEGSATERSGDVTGRMDQDGETYRETGEDPLNEWFQERDTETDQGKAEPEEGYYRVKRGDTLAGIAGLKEVYDDPLKWTSLLQLNLDTLSSLEVDPRFQHRELPAGLHLKFITPEEATKNLKKVEGKPWVINVLSARKPERIVPLAVKLIKMGYHVYLTRTDIGGDEWIRLRVGFFKTPVAAASIKKEISSILRVDDAWVTRVTERELNIYGGY